MLLLPSAQLPDTTFQGLIRLKPSGCIFANVSVDILLGSAMVVASSKPSVLLGKLRFARQLPNLAAATYRPSAIWHISQLVRDTVQYHSHAKSRRDGKKPQKLLYGPTVCSAKKMRPEVYMEHNKPKTIHICALLCKYLPARTDLDLIWRLHDVSWPILAQWQTMLVRQKRRDIRNVISAEPKTFTNGSGCVSTQEMRKGQWTALYCFLKACLHIDQHDMVTLITSCKFLAKWFFWLWSRLRAEPAGYLAKCFEYKLIGIWWNLYELVTGSHALLFLSELDRRIPLCRRIGLAAFAAYAIKCKISEQGVWSIFSIDKDI